MGAPTQAEHCVENIVEEAEHICSHRKHEHNRKETSAYGRRKRELAMGTAKL